AAKRTLPILSDRRAISFWYLYTVGWCSYLHQQAWGNSSCYLCAVKMPRRNTLSADVHIGRRVRLARQAAKMSSQALAQKLGVTFQQVQKYEKGKNRIAAAMLWEIAGILGHNINWFIEDVGPAHEAQFGAISDDVMRLALQVDRLPDE